jgi:hypothetical protein
MGVSEPSSVEFRRTDRVGGSRQTSGLGSGRGNGKGKG